MAPVKFENGRCLGGVTCNSELHGKIYRLPTLPADPKRYASNHRNDIPYVLAPFHWDCKKENDFMKTSLRVHALLSLQGELRLS